MTHWIKVGTLADFPAGKPVVHDFRYESAVLVRVGDTIYAIEDRCSHDDGPLSEGEVDGCQIICPRHGARFDLRTGEALTMPAVEDVPAYEVRVDGDEIWINGEL